MAPIYRIDLEDHAGQVVAQFTGSDYLSFNLDVTWNGKGSYQLYLSRSDERTRLFGPDFLLRFWMTDTEAGIPWREVFTGIHKTPVRGLASTGRKTFSSFGPSPAELLDSRYILYYAGSHGATKTGLTSSVMLAYVRENAGELALAANGRDVDGVIPGLTLAADPLAGPLWRGGRARRNLLSTLQDLARYSVEHGDPVDFRVRALPGYNWRFEVGRLSVDRTTRGLDRATGRNSAGRTPVIFSERWGNVASFSRSRSRYNEGNVIIALGQGEGDEREVEVVEDAPSGLVSPIARREVAVNASAETTPEALRAAGESRLRELLAREHFSFTPYKAGQLLFRDFDVGDFVTAEDEGAEFHLRVTKARINVGGSDESLTERVELEFEDA